MLDLHKWESDYNSTFVKSVTDIPYKGKSPKALRSILTDTNFSVERDIKSFRNSISDLETLARYSNGNEDPENASKLEESMKGLKFAIKRFGEIEKILKRCNLRRLPNNGELVERKRILEEADPGDPEENVEMI